MGKYSANWIEPWLIENGFRRMIEVLQNLEGLDVYLTTPLALFHSYRGTFKSRNHLFYNMWIAHEEFHPLVAQCWEKASQLIPNGTKQYQLKMKLNMLKAMLRQLNRLHFQHIRERVAKARE